MLALVDLDSMVIAAGALAEEVYYEVDNIRFAFKREANEYCDTNSKDRNEIERKVDVQPVANAINILKSTLNAAIQATGASEHEVYLGGDSSTNFRVAIDPTYKANRSHVIKPTHTKALCKYAVKHLDAVEVNGMEADDMLSIRAHEHGLDKTVIISIDKDMKQVPCYHYDWKKKTPLLKVEEWDAWCLFYTQLLVGDSVDNIKGCPGIGPVKAKTVLKNATNEEELFQAAKAAYIKAFDGDEDEAMEFMKLQARMLRLLIRRPAP